MHMQSYSPHVYFFAALLAIMHIDVFFIHDHFLSLSTAFVYTVVTFFNCMHAIIYYTLHYGCHCYL